jgi:hypothetical protein
MVMSDSITKARHWLASVIAPKRPSTKSVRASMPSRSYLMRNTVDSRGKPMFSGWNHKDQQILDSRARAFARNKSFNFKKSWAKDSTYFRSRGVTFEKYRREIKSTSKDPELFDT